MQPADEDSEPDANEDGQPALELPFYFFGFGQGGQPPNAANDFELNNDLDNDMDDQ